MSLRRSVPAFISFASLALLPLGAFAQTVTPPTSSISASTTEAVNADMMEKIRDEGMNRSQVMNTIGYVSDVIGPRLTGSPALKRANDWTKFKLMEWGLQNAALEAWGPFGSGWSVQKFSAQVMQPVNIGLIAYPKAWSPSLRRPVNAEVVYLDADTEVGLAKYRGTLKNKIVLLTPPRPVLARFEAQGTRYDDAALQAIADPPAPAAGSPNGARRGGGLPPAVALSAAKLKFAKDEGAALVMDSGRMGDDGTVYVQQASVPYAPDVPRDKRVAVYSKNAPKIIPQVTVSSEQYNRLVRMIEAGEKVTMNVEMKTQFSDTDNGMAFNTVAEIPGGDKKDEIVMCGAHMDSWHTGTGATDNAAGVGVCMEAVRILQALKVTPRRTIRIALWSGEEEGLFGSSAYVAKHFGTAKDPKPEYDKLSAYFNLDNGTGKVRGVWGQANKEAVPIFKAWLAPFADLGANTVTLRNTGSTDHIPFDAVGLPGFQFIQDTIEYNTRTHHSNQDVFDRIQEGDVKQASVVLAAFLYNAAMRDEKMPRKPVAPE